MDKVIEDIFREIKAGSKIKDRNVLNLHGICCDKELVLITELCKTDLNKKIKEKTLNRA